MKNSSTTHQAFTLIELLTVIAIIGILAALLFPAIKNALLRAETTKAQTAISGLAIAFKSYYTEYGKWPVGDTSLGCPNLTNYTYTVDTNLVALLQGANNTASLTGGCGLPPFNSTVSTSTLQGNPRGIRFLEFKQAEIDPKLGFLDPWKGPYYCRFDVSYANQVPDPFTGGGGGNPTNVQTGFLVWSAGPDGQYDDGGPTDQRNKDNVKNW